MGEHKEEKWLYSFYIAKPVEVEKQFEEEVKGEMVKVTRKVTEQTNVRFS